MKALRGVSLEIVEGEIFGLIGPNGAGKTTLLNVIAGVLSPDTGFVRLLGKDLAGKSPEAVCRSGVSRTFQIAQAFPHMTALENVLVAAVFGNPSGGWAEASELARQLLEFVEFPKSPSVWASDLNAIELKRLDLARALASHPKVLLLDELAAGLTPAELGGLVRLMRSIRDRRVALVVVEHLMQVVLEECDRVAVLCSGEKIAEGKPEIIARDPRVVDAYLGQTYSTDNSQ